jgi:hypothetical protein
VPDSDGGKSSDIVGTLGGVHLERRRRLVERDREVVVGEEGEDRGARHAR